MPFDQFDQAICEHHERLPEELPWPPFAVTEIRLICI